MDRNRKRDRIVIKEYALPAKKAKPKKIRNNTLKKYIIMSEVLGKPLALRGDKRHVEDIGS